MTPLQESLSKCRVEGNVLHLPSIDSTPLSNYAEVKKALTDAGAIYKRNTFVFKVPAQQIINKLLNGAKPNLKKEFQFFGTPAKKADWLVELADIEEGMFILEPEAGQGAIIEAIYRAFPYYMKGPNDKPCVTVDYFEINEINIQVLSDKAKGNVRWSSATSNMGEDFLKSDVKVTGQYDRVIANPPFSKNQDIDHIYAMFTHCKPGGRIVTMASKHWQLSNNRKEKQFKEFIDQYATEVIDMERGDFQESGTMIQPVVIVINKPKL